MQTTCLRSGWTGWLARRSGGGATARGKRGAWAPLHPATRYGHGRRDRWPRRRTARGPRACSTTIMEVCNTWYGGELVVENRTVTPASWSEALSKPYRYPASAYRTVHSPENVALACCRRCRRGPLHRQRHPHRAAGHPRFIMIASRSNPPCHAEAWPAALVAWSRDCVSWRSIERHGKSGAVAHGLLRRLRPQPVARWPAAVGHDSHNLIVAGHQRTRHAGGHTLPSVRPRAASAWSRTAP